jgi:hypothetical protein
VTPTTDGYAIVPGTTFSTVKATGVLANDGTATTAILQSGPTRGTLVGGLKADGSFTYVPGAGFTSGTDTFTYTASDGTTTSGPITVTIAVAQQSGTSPEGTVTPQSGLTGWSVYDDGNLNGPSNWSGAQSPVLTQLSAIDSTEAVGSLLQRGTLLYLTDGLPQQRTDYTLTFTVKSGSTGALGVLFRYTPDPIGGSNYSGYRFSMDRGAGYMRLAKIVDGQVVGNQPLIANSVAYQQNIDYTLTISAKTISSTSSTLTVQLRNPISGQLEANFSVTDSTNPLNGTGLSLYSANNPGGSYNLLGAQFDGAPPPTNAVLEVLLAGTGSGTVSSNPGGIVLPGSPAATYTAGQPITLTALPINSTYYTFSGWTGPIDPATGQIASLPSGVTTVTATFGGTPSPVINLDVNGDGAATPQDAIIILRYLSLVTGPALTAGVVSGGTRTDPAVIKAYLDQARTTMLDVNQDGLATPQDAIVILRHLSLVSGPALTAGVISGGAQTDPAAIKTYLNHYMPGAVMASATVSSEPPPSASMASTSAQSSALSSQDAADVSTTASNQLLVLPSDPVQTEAITIPGTPDSQLAAALVGLDDFRGDPRFANIDGSAFATVIIDTGIDLDHPYFGPDADHNGIADRIIYQYDFADNDPDASDRNGHGSNIASIIGSQDTTDRGVAPGTDLIMLKVFKDSGIGTFGDVERALQWVIDNQDTYHIGVVNMSLGDGGTWAHALSLYGIGDELAALANENVLLVSAAGNHYFDNGSTLGVAYPGADPVVLSVGAVWTADFGGPWNFSSGARDLTTGPDHLASFSQRDHDLLDVFAPGARLTGASATGGRLTLQGTSQASAYVAGVASLAQEVAFNELGRRLTPNEFVSLVRLTGDHILDGDDEQDNVRNSEFTFPRVNVERLAEDILRLKNDPPVVMPDTFTLTENSAAGTIVGTIHATDPDPHTVLAYRIAAGNDAGAFVIDAQTGTITVADGTPLDFETTPRFLLTVEVTDDGIPALTGRATITVNLTNANEAPVVESATFTVAENAVNGTVVGTVRATDPDASTTLAYAIVSGNTRGAFALDPVTGVLTVANRKALDFESNSACALTVRVTDDSLPPLSDDDMITVLIQDVPDQFHRDWRPTEAELRWSMAIAAQQAWVRTFVGGKTGQDDLVVTLGGNGEAYAGR